MKNVYVKVKGIDCSYNFVIDMEHSWYEAFIAILKRQYNHTCEDQGWGILVHTFTLKSNSLISIEICLDTIGYTISPCLGEKEALEYIYYVVSKVSENEQVSSCVSR